MGTDMTGATRQDLRDMGQDLKDHFDEQFKAVHARLDRLNGKTEKHGEALARQDARLTGVEKEVFDRPHRRREDRRQDHIPSGFADLLGHTKQIGLVVLVVAGVAWTVVEGIFKIGDWLTKAGLR